MVVFCDHRGGGQLSYIALGGGKKYDNQSILCTEEHYSTLEMLALAFVLTARCLHPYFLSHSIMVLTNYTPGRILANPEASRRLIKWTTELSEYNI